MTRESNEQKKYPVSEIFTSPQGEGVYAGVLMTFIRLAGCTVGRPYPKEKYIEKTCFICGAREGWHGYDMVQGSSEICTSFIPDKKVKNLPIYTEKCTLYDGREFPCDTDYRTKSRMEAIEIVGMVPKSVENVCITGGEPLMHNLDELLFYLRSAYKKIHIETSGTVEAMLNPDIWVTVSPKHNCYYEMINRANEVKILVDEKFDPTLRIMTLCDDMVQAVDIVELSKQKPVFIQPVNFENEINQKNLKRCMEIQKQYPTLIISCQLHKAISAQIGELVR